LATPEARKRIRSKPRADADELKSVRVANRLERQILLGELGPGERLPTEHELCDLLGVSRSVVRDAMRMLSARGLVTIKQGHGMTVTESTDTAFGQALAVLLARSDLIVGDVIDARAAMETRLAPLMARNATPEDVDVASRYLEGFADAVEKGRWKVAHEQHLSYHFALLRTLHLPALELFFRPMDEIIVVTAMPLRQNVPEDWEVETHPPILDAIDRKDEAGAEEAMRAHFATMETERYRHFRERPFREVLVQFRSALQTPIKRVPPARA
jgi:DNA-binding FadR family transcriptional regulator